MAVTFILLGMIAKLGFSSWMLYRTQLWWAPGTGMIGMGCVLGFLTERTPMCLASIALGVPALCIARVLHQRSKRVFAR